MTFVLIVISDLKAGARKYNYAKLPDSYGYADRHGKLF